MCTRAVTRHCRPARARRGGRHAARRIEHVSTFHTSKSVVDEAAHLFVARDLDEVAATPDDTELIHRQIWPFDDVMAMVLDGEITDSMTVIAVLLADRRRR